MKYASVCVQRPRCPCPLRCPPAASKRWLTAPPPSGSAGRSRGSATCASSTTRCAAARPGPPTRRWCPTTPGQTPKPGGSEAQLSGGDGTLRAAVFVVSQRRSGDPPRGAEAFHSLRAGGSIQWSGRGRTLQRHGGGGHPVRP